MPFIPVVLALLAACAKDAPEPASAGIVAPVAVPDATVSPPLVFPPAALPPPAAMTQPGVGAVPTPEQWSGTWLFSKMALQLVIVEQGGALKVSATSTAAKEPGKPPVPCEPVVLTEELSCTIHSASTGKNLPIQLRRAGADPAHVDFLTILVGDYPVEVGSRQDVEGESESTP